MPQGDKSISLLIPGGQDAFPNSCEALGHYKLWDPYRNYTRLSANLGAPGSHAVVTMPVYGNAALCWHCCLCRPDGRADPRIKDSKEKKMGDAFCMFVSSGISSPTCFTVFVHSTWANTAAGRDGKCQGSRRKGQGIMVVRQSFCPASADGCSRTSRHSPRLLDDEITLPLS